MTRHERDQLIEIHRRVEMGDRWMAKHLLQKLIDVAAAEMAAEDAYQSALEQENAPKADPPWYPAIRSKNTE